MALEASEALEAFVREDYPRAKELLQGIADAKDDPKVANNIALVDYFASGKADPDGFAQQLAAGPSEPLEDCALQYYNRALLLHQSGGDPLPGLEELYVRLEPLEDVLAVKICLLLLEVYLQRGAWSRASSVLTYLGKTSSFPATKEGAKDAPFPSLCHGGFLRTKSGAARAEYQMLLEVYWSVLAVFEDGLTARTHLANAKEFLSTLENGSSIYHAYCAEAEAFLDYATGDYASAVRTLTSGETRVASEGPRGEASKAFELNNLGCVHVMLGKPGVAKLLFGRALSATSALQKRASEVAYNLGVQQLVAGNPVDALQHLSRVQTSACRRPLLWIRRGEASVEIYRATRQGQGPRGKRELGAFEPVTMRGRGLVARTVDGPGKLRRYVLSTPEVEGIAVDDPPGNAFREPTLVERPDVALAYACMCFKNALQEVKAQAKKGRKEESFDEFELATFEDAALTKLAEVFLCQRDYAAVLRCGWRLFEQNELVEDAMPQDDRPWALELKKEPAKKDEARKGEPKRSPSMLGPIQYMLAYSAEALLVLGRTAAARSLLRPAVVGSLLEDLGQRTVDAVPGGGISSADGFLARVPTDEGDPADARAMLYNNLAVLALQQQDTAEASKMLRKGLEAAPGRAVLVRTQAYLHLLQGNEAAAVALLTAQRD